VAEIKWIKISCDMFNDETINLVEQMPEGDAIIVIWLKLLILAGKTNDDGFVYFKKEIPYTDEMLATVFRRPLNTIRLALTTFERFGMIQLTDEKNIFISNWAKYQNIEGMERARELAKIRMRKSRAKKKQFLIETKKDDGYVTLRNSNATVTRLDIDIENKNKNKNIENKEKEINKEKEKKNFVAKSFFQKLFTSGAEFENYSHLKDLFIEFLEYKTAIKKQFKTESGVINAFKDFIRLSENNAELGRALVDNTIARGWQSIYELPREQKTAFRKQQNQSSTDVDDWESRCM